MSNTNHILRGRDAISFAKALGLTLSKSADPTEDAKTGLSLDEARAVAREGEDGSLIWIDARAAYVSRFENPSDAIEFENSTLSAGREFLPACALLVLDGVTPSADYWTWLIGQVDESEQDA